jgi:hypothetical protein
MLWWLAVHDEFGSVPCENPLELDGVAQAAQALKQPGSGG